jgi:hypothetical protein
MAMKYLWLLPTILFAAILFVILRLIFIKRKKSPKRKTKAQPLAHTVRIKSLPIYKRLILQYRIALISAITAFTVLIIAASTLASRPYSATIDNPTLYNRDIMLCLDVSGSMSETNQAVLQEFTQIARGLEGERIGFTIFDSTAVSVFPLTDDYEFIAEQLAFAERIFRPNTSSSELFAFLRGTWGIIDSSLIGDGLASCVNMFDLLEDTERSRFIILVTDNFVGRNPVVSLMQAAEHARARNIRVYGINPSDWSSEFFTPDTVEEFRRATIHTDGAYYRASEPRAIPDIIAQIQSQEAIKFTGAPRLIESDNPLVATIIIVISFFAFIVIVWRLKI